VVHANIYSIQALTSEHLQRREEEAASERLGRRLRLAYHREAERRRTMDAQRRSNRRIGRVLALALATAIGAGGTAGAYQAFAANSTRSRTPIPQHTAPAGSRIGSNLNPTGDCSGRAQPGNPFPC
jgi:hypothetical protein